MKNKIHCEMTSTLLATLTSMGSKIVAIFSSIWGWIATIILSFLTYLTPLKYLFLILSFLIILDFIFGISASIKLKKQITSDKMRSTILKIMVYIITIPLIFAMEKQLVGWEILSDIVFAIAFGVEGYSLISNMLIVNPNNPFLKFLKILLSGEIAKKLGIEKDKVVEELDKINKKNG